MDPFHTHGAFSWSELTTSDPNAAAAFYGGLFGWSVQSMPMGGGDYHVAKLGEATVAGIMTPPPGSPPVSPSSPPSWGVYLTVDNVEVTVGRCAELGGKTLVPPMDVHGVGRMAVLQDPQGAVFSVMAYFD
jgi:predicted enzyme related to lactoylglutathione lyase